MSDMLKLFPAIEPFNTGYMERGCHEIYYEQCGNPDGKPAVFLHGGPGGGGSTTVRRFFNPERYHIVFLTKEVAEEVSLMAVWNKIQHGILLKI